MPKRSEIWTLELARGVGRKSEELDKLKKERDYHKQETAHLKQQVDELSRLQHPREFKLSPPSTIEFGAPLLSSMAATDVPSTGFTVLDRNLPLDVVIERAIGRWKSVVKEARGSAGVGSGGGLAAQRRLSGCSNHSTMGNVPPQPQSQHQHQRQRQNHNPNGNANVNRNGAPKYNSNQSAMPVITTPQMTPTLTPTLVMDGDGDGSDADADADADMEDDDSYVEPLSEMGQGQGQMQRQRQVNGCESTGFRLDNGDGGGGGGGGGQHRSDVGGSSRMEGLEGQMAQGYVRIGARG